MAVEWFPTRRVVELSANACGEVEIASKPAGDLRHVWDAVIADRCEPTIKDVLETVQGRWLWITKVLRFSVSIDKPPVDMWLDVKSAMPGTKREYLYPEYLAPRFETRDEGAFKATLTRYYYQIAVGTLPGDKVYVSLESKEPFRGSLRILSCL